MVDSIIITLIIILIIILMIDQVRRDRAKEAAYNLANARRPSLSSHLSSQCLLQGQYRW